MIWCTAVGRAHLGCCSLECDIVSCCQQRRYSNRLSYLTFFRIALMKGETMAEDVRATKRKTRQASEFFFSPPEWHFPDKAPHHLLFMFVTSNNGLFPSEDFPPPHLFSSCWHSLKSAAFSRSKSHISRNCPACKCGCIVLSQPFLVALSLEKISHSHGVGSTSECAEADADTAAGGSRKMQGTPGFQTQCTSVSLIIFSLIDPEFYYINLGLLTI